MKLLGQFKQAKQTEPIAYSLVDIGRDTVKTVVILTEPESHEIQLIGHGLAKTGGHDVTGGRLEAAAVTNPVNQALTQAEDSTEFIVGRKIVPDDVIFSLPGRATIGKLFTVKQTRSNAKEPISVRELNQMKTRSDRLVRQGLAKLPVEGGQWQALAVNDAGLRLDNHLVLEGIGLTGRVITLSAFGIAGLAGALRALEVLANRLDLVMSNIVAAPHALASIAPYAEAIILDVGISGTDICLIRDDALVATDWVPFGGGYFTQALAYGLNIKWPEAEALKLALSEESLEQTKVDELNKHLEEARQRWYQAVMNSLKKLSLEKPLPWKIYLTGGGSLLPGLEKLLRSDPSHFDRASDVARLGPHTLAGIKDLTKNLDCDLFSVATSLVVGLPES